jgi:4a-hydroxytetrahydrobiopterin dehydratase
MDWEEKNNYLLKTFTFSNFINAFMFMTEVAALAEKMSHHPWWENAFHMVTIRLTTHNEENTITEKDRAMAQSIDEIYSKMRK